MKATTALTALLVVAAALPAAAQDDPRLAAFARHLDVEAVEQLVVHYGRANDILGRAGEAGMEEALQEYRRAFTEDATITVYPLGAAAPLTRTDAIEDWARFVATYFANEDYSSRLHLMGNFAAEITGESTIEASAFAINPHWIASGALPTPADATRTMDLMNVRYEYQAERQPSGEWRITDMTINLDEIHNVVGFFGAGQATN